MPSRSLASVNRRGDLTRILGLRTVGSEDTPIRRDTHLPGNGHDLHVIGMQTSFSLMSQSGVPMATVMVRASAILHQFEQVQSELVDKAVILTDGKAGTVEAIWLDELHGLRISIKGVRPSGEVRLRGKAVLSVEHPDFSVDPLRHAEMR